MRKEDRVSSFRGSQEKEENKRKKEARERSAQDVEITPCQFRHTFVMFIAITLGTERRFPRVKQA